MKDEHLILLGEISGKVDRVISRLQEGNVAISKLSTRVHSLEKWRAWLIGAAAVVAAMSSLLVQTLMDKLKQL